jgi:hypothetical protein
VSSSIQHNVTKIICVAVWPVVHLFLLANSNPWCRYSTFCLFIHKLWPFKVFSVCSCYLFFSFIVVMGKGTLWHLHRFLQCVKYIIHSYNGVKNIDSSLCVTICFYYFVEKLLSHSKFICNFVSNWYSSCFKQHLRVVIVLILE